MKIFLKILTLGALIFFSMMSFVEAFSFSEFIDRNPDEIPYCQDGECGLDEGIEELRALDDVVTDTSASVYIQAIVSFLLSFLAIVAVIYIIYAGFNILTGAGDDEKMSNGKKIIVYVLIGTAIIFLAAPIFQFIFDVLNGAANDT